MKPWRRRRRLGKILGAALRAEHWRAAANMPRVLERPVDGLRREALVREGRFPGLSLPGFVAQARGGVTLFRRPG